MNFFEDLDYIWWRFFAILFITLISFYWVWKSKKSTAKYYFIPFMLFPFIYAGAGFGWETCDMEYFWKYSFYFIVFSVTCYYAQKNRKTTGPFFEQNNSTLLSFFQKYGNTIVWFYISIKLFAIIADGKLINIVRPPALDMDSMIEGSYMAKSVLSQLAWYLDNIVFVFYIVSLYNYRNSFKKFFFYLVIPVYLEYVDLSYLGRGTMMLTAINLVIGFLLCYPKYKKTVIVSAIILAPITIFGLVWYSAFRMGASIDDISVSKAIQILSYQETSYPLHYKSIKSWGFDPEVCFSYLYWLVTLPFPGFMRSGDVDIEFNYLFSEKINGTIRGDADFSVSLPGLVNEGVFVFGPTFFILHAVILGFFVGKTYKWIKYSPELFLFIHCCVNVAYSVSRGGTGSQYSFYLKNLLIYLIVRYIILNVSKTRMHNNGVLKKSESI